MSTLERLSDHLGARYSPNTRKTFLGQAGRFVEFCGSRSDYTRDDVLRYVDVLLRQGHKASSIHVAIAAIRALFRENGIAWTLDARDLRLGLPEEDPEAPALLASEVRRLITGVRTRRGIAAATVCLASMFGLRSDEIVRVLGAGCDGKTLDVQTAKGGRRRSHLIPGLLAPYLVFPSTPVSTRYLHTMFEGLMAKYVRPPVAREGWHALRRTLVSELCDAGVEEAIIHKWMGWKGKESIVTRYRLAGKTAGTYDQQVWEVHPFLAAWRLG